VHVTLRSIRQWRPSCLSIFLPLPFFHHLLFKKIKPFNEGLRPLKRYNLRLFFIPAKNHCRSYIMTYAALSSFNLMISKKGARFSILINSSIQKPKPVEVADKIWPASYHKISRADDCPCPGLCTFYNRHVDYMAQVNSGAVFFRLSANVLQC